MIKCSATGLQCSLVWPLWSKTAHDQEISNINFALESFFFSLSHPRSRMKKYFYFIIRGLNIIHHPLEVHFNYVLSVFR